MYIRVVCCLFFLVQLGYGQVLVIKSRDFFFCCDPCILYSILVKSAHFFDAAFCCRKLGIQCCAVRGKKVLEMVVYY